MSKGLEALERIINHLEYIEEDYKKYAGIDLDTIEKELKRLEELEKAFVALSKDDEKAKKLLSKEIEKNRALEIIKRGKILYVYTDSEDKHYLESMYYAKIELKNEDYYLLKKVLR